MSITYDAVDLFAGPGGWDIAAKWLGLRVMGVEFDDAACRTRKAAGLNTVKADVLDVDPLAFQGVKGLIASPPCQTFSMAGKGEGRKALDKVLAAIDELAAGRDPWDFIEVEDVRTKLVLVPLQWAIALEPEWIAWEQVPTVLPVWERCADVLRSMGYSVVTGNLQAEQYGVPQTRKRAVLVARKHGGADLPQPTHTRYSKGKPRQADDLLPWVSMAEALGWGDVTVISNYGTGGDPSNRGERDSSEPFATVTSKADRFVVAAGVTGEGTPRHQDDPAPTVTGKGTAYVIKDEGDYQPKRLRNNTSDNAGVRDESEPAPTMYFGQRLNKMTWEPSDSEREAFSRENQQLTYKADVADYKPWTEDRPATTIATRDLVPDPGANANRFNGSTKSRNDGVRVSIEEASVLQSFPADYPWQGTKSKQFEQVGNAIPPLLAQRVMLAALGLPMAGAVEAWHAAREAVIQGSA